MHTCVCKRLWIFKFSGLQTWHTRYIRERCPDSMSSGLCSVSLFLFFITLSHPHYKRPLRGAKGERKKESTGLEQGKWIEGGYCGKRDYCPALSCLNPTILLSFNTFQWRPPTSHPPPHTQSALNLPPQTAWNLLFSPGQAGGGGLGVGWGDKYGGVGCFGGTSGRFLTPASSILHGSTRGPHNPLCWDWWPAVVRETNTLLKQAYMDITGSEADLWRHSLMYPKSFLRVNAFPCILFTM